MQLMPEEKRNVDVLDVDRRVESPVAEANLQIDLKEITCMVMWVFL